MAEVGEVTCNKKRTSKTCIMSHDDSREAVAVQGDDDRQESEPVITELYTGSAGHTLL